MLSAGAQRPVCFLIKNSFDCHRQYHSKSYYRLFLLEAKRLIVDGTPFLIATGADIDDRKQAEYALDISEKKFRSITEQLDGVVFICDAQGFFSYVSPLAEKFLGFTPQEMIGHRFTEFLGEKDSSKALEGLNKTLSDSTRQQGWKSEWLCCRFAGNSCCKRVQFQAS